MKKDGLCIFGAGGLGKVVYDAAILSGEFNKIQVVDSNEDLNGCSFFDTHIISPIPESDLIENYVHIAIGNNEIRLTWGCFFEKLGKKLVSIVHPHSSVSLFSKIESGVFISAQAVVAPHAVVEKGTIVNHGAIIDHDCMIGQWCHICPGSRLGGGVKVGNSVLIGAGSTVLPGIEIGHNAVIGAGAVVTKAVQPGTTVVGVPAKRQKNDSY